MAKKKRKSEGGTSSKKSPSKSSVRTEQPQKGRGVKRMLVLDKGMTPQQIWKRAMKMAE